MRKFVGFCLLTLIVGTMALVYVFGPGAPGVKNSPVISVFLTDEQKKMMMPLERYLVGVVAAEMPANFEKEALKAQAIAARTYALKKLMFDRFQVNKDHPKAPVCTNPAHCQGWMSDQEMKARWGWLRYWEYKRKIINSVNETAGKVITYQGELIEPVYHSTCGAATENAGEIWRYTVPYLKSVACAWDQASPKYKAVTFLNFTELKKQLGVDLAVKAASKANAKSIEVLERTATGRIKTILVGTRVWTGSEFRRCLGLNSTNITWKVKEQGIEFITVGYGHGVGMCQYGANGLARRGYTAEKIISYYYSGVKVKKEY